MKAQVNLNFASQSGLHSFNYREESDRFQAAGYGAVYPDKVTRDLLADCVAQCGLQDTVDPKEYHVTMMYDVGNPALYHPNPRMWHQAIVKDAALFGPDNDVLVLRLKSDGLEHRHQYLRSVGYRHSYPQYEPHMTIKLGATEEDLNAVNAAIESGTFDAILSFGKEAWEPIS